MFETRPMTSADIPECLEILNHTIRKGGTTAYEDEHTRDSFEAEFLHKPPIGVVVEHEGRIVGFQNAYDYGDGLYSIGSFTDQQRPVKGAGRAMFAATLEACRARGGVAILARITSDNASGLAYYSAMGFADDYIIPKDVTRRNGKTVDRVVKRFPL
ncbi:N-acetyltransferase family protein [Sagittula sp. S175]|uniref:GNAT family N-acetyltransferase n=1 Tax=Sagittula sp. S175 TaxID=3415129 RepID=UPI003C7EAC4F